MLRIGLIGLGKMGLSHAAIANSHPRINLVALCDSSPFLPSLISDQMGIRLFSDPKSLFNSIALDAVIVATPTRFHAPLVRSALENNLHVFCEKPFCLGVEDGKELAVLADRRGLVNQVGYHYRFLGAFKEAKNLIATKALGKIHHIRAEAYGPVVLNQRGSTWRGKKEEGGGCLYDYASHAIDLVNYVLGPPERVGGTVLNKVFSNDVNDEVYSTLYFKNGVTGQLAANWSDESYRKMYVRLSIWGTNGRMNVDRQELQMFVRKTDELQGTVEKGWSVRYTTELTEDVWYYMRGEEYSEQIDHFVRCIEDRSIQNMSSFASAVEADRVVSMLVNDAYRSTLNTEVPIEVAANSKWRSRTILRNLRLAFRA